MLSQARLISVALALSLVLPLAWLATRDTFLAIDPVMHTWHPQNFLWDDGGHYRAGLEVFRHPSLRREAWFQTIAAITPDDFLRAWGPWGSRVTVVFTRHLYDGYFSMLSMLSIIAGLTSTQAFSYALILLAGLIAAKYVLLVGMFWRSDALLAVIAGNVCVDLLYSIARFQGSEYFALTFATAGATMLFWGHSQILGAVLVAIAATMNPLAIPAALALGLGTIVLTFRWDWSERILVACLVVIVVMSTVNLVTYVGTFGTVGALRMWSNTLERRYFAPWVLVPLLAIVRLGTPHHRRTVLWLLVGAACYVTMTPWMGAEVRTAGGRFATWISAFALLALAQRWHHHAYAFRRFVLAGLALLWLNTWMTAEIIKPPAYLPFTRHEFPAEVNGRYIALSPQQVYGYFIEADYTRGPLEIGWSAE